MNAEAYEQITLVGLAKRLVSDGLLEEGSAKKAVFESQREKSPFVLHLVENKIISAYALAHAASHDFGVPLFDLSAYDEEMIPLNVLSSQLIREHHVLPLSQRQHRLYIAVSDPTDLKTLDTIKFHTGLNTHTILVEEDKLSAALENFLNKQASAELGDLNDDDLDSLDISNEEEEQTDMDAGEVDDAPVVRFVNKVILDAINRDASDIHFEPYEKSFRVRFRQDGILEEIATPPVHLASRIAARVKIMSRLDISERRIPQDGRFKMILSKNRTIDFRISTCPTLYGEKIVIRVLDPSAAKLGIEHLGYEDAQKELFIQAIHKPQGMVLVTGPTGSGKTVSLYTALNILNTTDKNISTVEDPVEINLPGINQVHVNLKTGLTFSTALRSFLRQDPDIIMLGEIRDLETAEIAIKASQTGHLVLSTLHTNSAPETLTRLVNMGVEPFNIATSVTLIIAQRLARRLCQLCKVEETITEKALLAAGFTEDETKGLKVFGPNITGCEHCLHGYKGRLGIYEVLEVTDAIGRIIMDGGNALNILDKALEQGLQTLRRSGLNRVSEGLTSLEEVNRVTRD